MLLNLKHILKPRVFETMPNHPIWLVPNCIRPESGQFVYENQFRGQTGWNRAELGGLAGFQAKLSSSACFFFFF